MADVGQNLFEELNIVTLGGNEVAWNQKDSAGRTVASGVYWAVLDIDGRRSVRKIAIAR